MTMKKRWILLLMAPTWLACLTPSGEPFGEGGASGRSEQAEMDGSLGRYEAGVSTRVAVDHDDYVELRSSSDTGAVMMGLGVDEGFDQLEPGVHEFSNWTDGASVLGCAGDSEGAWSWDRRTRDVTIRVRDLGEGNREIAFDAEWGDGSRVEGAFVRVAAGPR